MNGGRDLGPTEFNFEEPYFLKTNVFSIYKAGMVFVEKPYLSKFKKALCKIFGITPEKRFTCSITFSASAVDTLNKSMVFATKEGHKFLVTSRDQPPHSATASFTAEMIGTTTIKPDVIGEACILFGVISEDEIKHQTIYEKEK